LVLPHGGLQIGQGSNTPRRREDLQEENGPKKNEGRGHPVVIKHKV